MKAVVCLSILCLASTCLAEHPADKPSGSLRYSRMPLKMQLATERRDERRAAEHRTWSRVSIAHPPLPDDKRADAQYKLAVQLLDMGKYEACDRWMAQVADKYPATAAAELARFAIGAARR